MTTIKITLQFFAIFSGVWYSSISSASDMDHILEEFIQINSTDIADKNELELLLTTSVASSDELEETNISAELEYGISERTAIEFELTYGFVDVSGDSESDLSGANFEVRNSFYQTSNRTLTAGIELEIESPLDSDEREYEWESSIQYSTYTGSYQISLDAGIEFEDDETNFFYGAGLAKEIGSLIGAIELFSEAVEISEQGEDSEDRAFYLTPSAHWEIGDYLIQIGSAFGLNDAAKDWMLVFQVEFE